MATDDAVTFTYSRVNSSVSKATATFQGVKLIFFSDSHLAPKFIKVVANSKKVGRHFERQTKPFFLRCHCSRN